MRHAIFPASLALALALAPRLALADEDDAAAPPPPCAAGSLLAPLDTAHVGRPLPPPPKPGYEPRNPGMLTTGIVLGSIGLLSAGTGGILYAAAPRGWDGLGQAAAGYLMMAGGGLVFAIGTGLGIAGGVPASRGDRASAVPRVAIGPRAASLTWTF